MGTTPQLSVRLPDEVKQMLYHIIAKDRRNITEEITHLIEKRFSELQEPKK